MNAWLCEWCALYIKISFFALSKQNLFYFYKSTVYNECVVYCPRSIELYSMYEIFMQFYKLVGKKFEFLRHLPPVILVHLLIVNFEWSTCNVNIWFPLNMQSRMNGTYMQVRMESFVQNIRKIMKTNKQKHIITTASRRTRHYTATPATTTKTITNVNRWAMFSRICNWKKNVISIVLASIRHHRLQQRQHIVPHRANWAITLLHTM